MAVPSTHRWIAIGHLVVRNDKRASPKAPSTSLDEVMTVAKKRLAEKAHYREYGREKSRIMWFSNFGKNAKYHLFLADVGDKNTAGVSFVNFETRTTRDVAKEDDEGGQFTAHITISKTPTKEGGHLILVERVPGIYLASLKDHFAWLCRDDRLQKNYVDEAGKQRKGSGVFEIDGHQSSTIRDALKTGTLQDIEFIQVAEDHPDGLDEKSVVKDVVHQAKWEIKQKVSEDQAGTVFKSMRRFFREKFKKVDADSHMFVRIKTNVGQIKRTEIADGDDPVLEQAFVHNELINDFDTPLGQRHEELRDDVIKKMVAIAEDLSDKAKADA